jgi:hypothetical protein
MPTQRELCTGDPFGDTDLNEQWTERGTIVDVHPEYLSCDVQSETTGIHTGLALPHCIQDPEGGGGQAYIPRKGQRVILKLGLGRPVITQILPMSVDVVSARSAVTVTPGSAPATRGSASGTAAPANYAARAPKDLLPGDFVQIGNQGQYAGVLDGGVALLHASPWSQVVCNQEEDTTVIAGRNLNLLTDFGNIRFTSDGGKFGFVLEGATDQLTEAAENNWAVQLRVGSESEGLADFRINDRKGTAVSRVVWQADGSLLRESKGIISENYPGIANYEYGSDLVVTVGGAHTLSVGADRTENFYGSLNTLVSQSRSMSVLQDRFDTINRDWNASVGRNMVLSISGDQAATPGAVAAGWGITNGSWIVDVGFPGAGELGSALSAIEFNTYSAGGSITLSSALDKIILDTTTIESVLLGSSKGVASLHAVLWEPLQTFLEALVKWLDAHVHPTGMGPSGSPTPPSSSVLTSLVNPIQSRKVLLGG